MRDDYVNKTAGPNLLVSDVKQPRLPKLNFRGDRWNVSRDDDETLSLEIGVAGVLYKEYLDSTISYDAGLFRTFFTELTPDETFTVPLLGLNDEAHNLITITVFFGDNNVETRLLKDVYNGVKVLNDKVYFETNEDTQNLLCNFTFNDTSDELSFKNVDTVNKKILVITKVDRAILL